MASKKQIAANRKNARKSTGPKSRKGKITIRHNALRHGLTSADVVLPDEDEGAFQEILENLVSEHEPEGITEEMLVQRIAAMYWRLLRMGKVEAGLFTMGRYEVKRAKAQYTAKKYMENPDDYSALIDGRKTIHRVLYNGAKAEVTRMDRLMDDELPRLAPAFARDAMHADAFGKLLRYEGALERSLYRALQELRVQQLMRGKPVMSATPVVDITPAVTAPSASKK